MSRCSALAGTRRSAFSVYKNRHGNLLETRVNQASLLLDKRDKVGRNESGALRSGGGRENESGRRKGLDGGCGFTPKKKQK